MDFVSVAVIDDNALLRKSLIERLEHTGKIKVLLSAISGADILSKVAHLPVSSRPVLYLMDIEMDNLDGIEATSRLKKMQPDALVIMLTVFDDEDKILRAIQSGASGYLLKDEPTDTILRAINDVLAGGSYMTPIIARKALNLLRSNTTAPEVQDTDKRPLTTRELEILELIVSGVSYRDIADRLFISLETVRKHVRNIYEKLHVHNKVDAMRIAVKRKWFQV